MRVIAFMNQKGGVGKTTTTVNLGAALAELGKRVCLVDLDPQSHLSINYGVDPNPDLPSLYNILVDQTPFTEAVHKVNDRISLVPSSIDLAAAEIELVNVPGRETLLKRRIEAANVDYDFMLIDCPPSLGLLTLNALSVAGEVIIPMQPHFLALQGVAKLLETVHLVSRRINPQLKVTGIVLTMFDSQTKLSMEVVNELNGFILDALGKPLPWADAKVFDTRVRRNIKLAESPSFGKTIIDYDAGSNGAADYRALARELLGVKEAPVMPTPRPIGASRAKAAGTNAPPTSASATSAVATSPGATVASAQPAEARGATRPAPASATRTAIAAQPPPTTNRTSNAAGAAPAAPAPAAPSAARANRAPALPPGPPPERTGPIRPVPPIGIRSARPVEVTMNPRIDATRLAAANVGGRPSDAHPASGGASSAEEQVLT